MRRVASITVIVALAGAAPALADDSPPGNLGNGLSRLIEPPAAKAGIRMTQAPLAIRDRQGRVLVDVYAEQGAPLPAVRDRAEQAGLQTVTQADDALEGYVALDDVNALAKAAGVASVSQALKPYTNVGAATSQGVAAERVDRVPRGIDGRGITVGALSDSFDTATETVDGKPLTVHAADDIRTGDLPPEGVTVLEDAQGGADEGRAMLQIVHDVAPKARECFATAFTGDLGFANNIRALADPTAPAAPNVIVDDVGYFDEPFFSRGPISDAVDAVAAQGVHYFSSAGNGSSQQAYAAPLRHRATPRAGSNINLAGVDPKLYAGGFEDFDQGPGTDIAQNMVAGRRPDQRRRRQRRHPRPAVGRPGRPERRPARGPADRHDGGDHRGAADREDPVQRHRRPDDPGDRRRDPVRLDGLHPHAQGPGRATTLQEIDTGTSPETVVQTLASTGTYTFEVSGFDGDLGDFTFKVQPVLGNSRTTTDLNALFFDAEGNFLFASQDLNRLSGKPFEIAGFHGKGALQLVIAKANTDASAATQLRYQLYDGLEYTEYVQPLAPSIYGHPLARGATAVAAYDPFRPFLPEDYTSVGGDLPIYFDSSGNRLPRPDIRRAPQVAATDGGNTTFFTVDSKLDPDSQPNFFGTSAAAPHAAAIAALVLQKHRQPAALTRCGRTCNAARSPTTSTSTTPRARARA